MTRTSNLGDVYTKQRRIAMFAAESPQMALTSLNHYLDIEWLREAFRRTRKNGAPGVDGQTWSDYEANLEENLQSLLDRAKSGTYRAPPVRRVHIPKGGSTTETRPIGIPTIEDKVLQRAVVMILEAVYRWDFHDCSHGFRRGRSAHGALESLWEQDGSEEPDDAFEMAKDAGLDFMAITEHNHHQARSGRLLFRQDHPGQRSQRRRLDRARLDRRGKC